MKETTIKVYTKPGTNASEIGSIYGASEGISWKNAVDRCNSDGTGIVFIVVDEDAVDIDYLIDQMNEDDAIDMIEY